MVQFAFRSYNIPWVSLLLSEFIRYFHANESLKCIPTSENSLREQSIFRYSLTTSMKCKFSTISSHYRTSSILCIFPSNFSIVTEGMQYFCIVERKIADTFSLDKKKKKRSVQRVISQNEKRNHSIVINCNQS